MDVTIGGARLVLGDALEVMAALPDASVSLIVADPPYFKVKDEPWDRQWDTPAKFLDWIGRLCEQWVRILKPNGSLYCFASPRMAARVECKIGETFNVLNQIVWAKSDATTHAIKYGDDRFRLYVQKSERIVFAEKFGSDGQAEGGCGETFLYRPVALYLRNQRDAAGLTDDRIDSLCGWKAKAFHFFALNASNFNPPTAENYLALQRVAPGFFRREYEDLRREYEDLRRPFAVSASVPYTDVWDFPTVPARPGKHPCAKPLPMISHIVSASSRPGDVVLDPFMGGGVTGEACCNLGRSFIGIEQCPKWFKRSGERINGSGDLLPFARRCLEAESSRTPLFAS